MGDGNDDSVDILASGDQLAGVWANEVRVFRRREEFMLDFLRVDISSSPPREAVLVARVALPPSRVNRLLDLLDFEMGGYAAEGFPREVYGDEPGLEDQGGAG
jgi:hypothetical protein